MKKEKCLRCPLCHGIVCKGACMLTNDVPNNSCEMLKRAYRMGYEAGLRDGTEDYL